MIFPFTLSIYSSRLFHWSINLRILLERAKQRKAENFFFSCFVVAFCLCVNRTDWVSLCWSPPLKALRVVAKKSPRMCSAQLCACCVPTGNFFFLCSLWSRRELRAMWCFPSEATVNKKRFCLCAPLRESVDFCFGSSSPSKSVFRVVTKNNAPGLLKLRSDREFSFSWCVDVFPSSYGETKIVNLNFSSRLSQVLITQNCLLDREGLKAVSSWTNEARLRSLVMFVPSVFLSCKLRCASL